MMKIHEDDHFPQNLIWTDETKFMKNGMFNRCNSQYWSDTYPHELGHTQFQAYLNL